MVPLNVLLLENPEVHVQPPIEHERPIVKFRQQLQQDPHTYPKHDGPRQHHSTIARATVNRANLCTHHPQSSSTRTKCEECDFY